MKRKADVFIRFPNLVVLFIKLKNCPFFGDLTSMKEKKVLEVSFEKSIELCVATENSIIKKRNLFTQSLWIQYKT